MPGSSRVSQFVDLLFRQPRVLRYHLDWEVILFHPAGYLGILSVTTLLQTNGFAFLQTNGFASLQTDGFAFYEALCKTLGTAFGKTLGTTFCTSPLLRRLGHGEEVPEVLLALAVVAAFRLREVGNLGLFEEALEDGFLKGCGAVEQTVQVLHGIEPLVEEEQVAHVGQHAEGAAEAAYLLGREKGAVGNTLARLGAGSGKPVELSPTYFYDAEAVRAWAEALAGKTDCAPTESKVNVDEEPELANAFDVVSIPMLVLMKDGKVAKTAVGYMPLEKLETLLN